MTVRLARGVDPKEAIRALDSAATDLENKRASTPNAGDLRNVYQQWADIQHSALRQYLGLARADELIQGRFYWYALTMDTAETGATGRLYQGMTNEAVRVREIATELKTLMAVLTAPEGWHTAVIDTNALVLVKPPWDVDWAKLVGATPLRLLLPLRVIEELDKHKYGNEKTITRVARALLPQLEKRLTENHLTKLTVNDRLTIEVPIIPGFRDRTLHADEEILRLCEDIQQFGHQALTLVTDDTSMRIQARARGITTVGIANEFRRAPVSMPIATDQGLTPED
jgi:hypothetical protein